MVYWPLVMVCTLAESILNCTYVGNEGPVPPPNWPLLPPGHE